MNNRLSSTKQHKKIYYGDFRNVYEELGLEDKKAGNDPIKPRRDAVWCIVAGSGQGKTNSLITINEQLDLCDRVILFTGGSLSNEPIYEYFDSKLNADEEDPRFEAYEGFEKFDQVMGEIMKDPDLKEEKIMCIVDDFIGSNKKQLEKLAKFSIRSRKTTQGGFSFIWLSQNYYEIPRLVRLQMKYMLLGFGFDRSTLRQICNRFSCADLTIDQIYDMYLRATKNKDICDWMLIDMATKHNNLKFREGFTRAFIIDPSDGLDLKTDKNNERQKEESDSDDDQDSEYGETMEQTRKRFLKLKK